MMLSMVPGFRTNFFNDADSFFNRDFNAFQKENRGLMRTDIQEKDGLYLMKMDLPGFDKQDIEAELKDGYLVVSASNQSEENEKDKKGNFIRRERYYGSCSRSFFVGEDITEEDIKAKFEDGILKISVPKKEAKPQIEQKKVIAIEG